MARAKTAAPAQTPAPYFLTGKLGQALMEQNERARAALKEDGIRLLPEEKRLPLEFSGELAIVNMGKSIAGDNGRPDIVWPDFKKLEAQWKEARPKMSDETKAELRAMGVAKGPKDIGDEVARMLREAHTLDDVYRIAAGYLGVPERELRTKYGHLNPGQQRMNCGNRMRGKWRKDHSAGAAVAVVVEKPVKKKAPGIKATGKVYKGKKK